MNCAHSVIELIMLHWPHSIDLLQPERAVIGGPLPVFFSGPSVSLSLVSYNVIQLIFIATGRLGEILLC